MQLYLQLLYYLTIKVKSKKLKLVYVSAPLDNPQATVKLIKIITMYFQYNLDGIFSDIVQCFHFRHPPIIKKSTRDHNSLPKGF
jgi:hypothetical protein